MNNKLIFVRHAKTKVDKAVPIENWILTDEGKRQANGFSESGKFDDVDILISSNEEKAYLTIKPLADKLGKQVLRVKELGEIKRPNSEKLTFEEYEKMKAKIFENLDYTEHDWETANHALQRFGEAIGRIDKEYENKKILICAHGTVMTLYFAFLQNKLKDIFSRWKGLEFGAYGVVENGKVLKDIV